MDWFAKYEARKAQHKETSQVESLTKTDQRSDIAHYILIASVVASALSAGASAWAAWSTATQAKYAQQALTAADLNRGFEAFYDKWSTLCDTIDVTDGYIGFGAKGANDLKMVIEATDLGLSFEPVDRYAQRMKVIKAMDEAVAAQEKLALWLQTPTLRNMKFENVLNNMIIISRIDTDENESKHYSAMLKQVGYCRLWKGWFMNWFTQGYPPTPSIDYKDIRLIFNGRDGGVLNDEYIRKSRALPWNDLHRYAPP